MNPEGKTKASQRAIACASEATRKLNPHLFYGITGPTKVIYDDGTEYKPKKRIRQDKPLNKLEQEAYQYLIDLDIYRHLRAQSKRFRLANGVTYTPDVTGLSDNEPAEGTAFQQVGTREIAWEVKGKRFEDDAAVKIKTAAMAYPEIRWWIMWKDQGQWQFQEVLP